MLKLAIETNGAWENFGDLVVTTAASPNVWVRQKAPGVAVFEIMAPTIDEISTFLEVYGYFEGMTPEQVEHLLAHAEDC